MILMTGVTGFVGGAIARAQLDTGIPVAATARNLPANSTRKGVSWHEVGAIDGQTHWLDALGGVQTVIHCAARAHIMRDQTANALATYREVNVDGTLRLAQQAASVGVQRFVFLSSIKVNGEATSADQPFTEADKPAPEDAYGQSKLEGELTLLSVAAQTGMEVVIIRPPLVYGPGAKGNFISMLQVVQRGLPLPLGAVQNQRSLVALDNLVSLALLCADRERSPQAANQVFVVADGEDVSTSTLLRKVARAAGRPSRLLPVPTSWLRAGASLLGKRAVADRLVGNLQVDATKARSLLGWRPVVTMDEQLDKMFKQKD